jgi:WXG100 family type VII secretion target
MAIGPGVHQQSDTLLQAASTANVVSTDITSHRTAMFNFAEPYRAQWQGTASPAFFRVLETWDAGVQRLADALARLGESTQYSANTVAAADEAGSTAVSAAQGLAPFGGALQAPKP